MMPDPTDIGKSMVLIELRTIREKYRKRMARLSMLGKAFGFKMMRYHAQMMYMDKAIEAVEGE